MVALLVQHSRIDHKVKQAKLNFQQHHEAEGLRLLKEAEEIFPQNSSSAGDVCYAYHWSNDHRAGAEACLRLAPHLNAQMLWFQVGNEYLEAKDYAQAADAFARIAPGSDQYLNHEWYVYSLLLSKQYERAIPACLEFQKVNAQNRSSLVTERDTEELLAIAYEGAGRLPEAQRIYIKFGESSCRLDVNETGYSRQCKPLPNVKPQATTM